MRLAALAATWMAIGIGPAGALLAAESPDFATQIRPLLARSCYACHGPEKQKSGYRLDRRSVALQGGDFGEPAIVPHNAARSPLIRYVSGADKSLQMPPADSGQPALTEAEVALLKAWIDAGPSWPDAWAGEETAAQPPHWSLLPLVRPALPQGTPLVVDAVGNAPTLAANPIDAFIRARLVVAGLTPSPPADRRVLIRRLYYDLHGLPPTPEEVDAFVAEVDPGAYDRLVDRLLASPRYGERWARHWFDTIHFADTHGYEHDVARENAWRYRDYVIGALNDDLPYDRFIREQLATDYLYPDRPERTAALGYLGAGTFDLSTFSTAVATFDYLDRDDLVTQTMASFVSTTANCARCHAHKFDPISQEDYYALQAVFAGVTKGDLLYDPNPAVARARRRWQTLLVAADPPDAAVLLTPEHEAQAGAWLTRRGTGPRWRPLEIKRAEAGGGATLTRQPDGSYLAGGPRPEEDTYTLVAETPLDGVTGLKLSVLPHESLPMRGPGRQDNGNLHLSEIEVQLQEPGGAPPRTLKIAKASADFNQQGWSIDRAIDGNQASAWGIYPEVGKEHFAIFEFAEKQALPKGTQLVIRLQQLHGGGHLIGAFHLAATADAAPHAAALPSAVAAALALPEAERSPAQRLAIVAYAVKSIAAEELARLPAPSPVYAAATTVTIPGGSQRTLSEPKVVHLLKRGDFDKPLAVVGPGALSALKHRPARFQLQDPKREAERRAALAEWIADRDNVLTWRSIVNRVWHYHFGRGLCDTPSDFGKMGGTPSHPELIDYLAVWFRDDAQGSLKALHRLIVTSDTYRQSSSAREEAARLDGANRLLWRQHRHRLDADAIRDFSRAVSGRLDLAMGGPGVRHFTTSPGPQATPKLDYTAYDWTGPGSGRRSIYRFVWRGIPDPFMEALDFPDLGLLSPARAFSASSLQALTLFNNEFMLVQSRSLAERLERECPTDEERVARAVRLLWLRSPTEAELRRFQEFAAEHGLPALCRVLLNSNEFLFVE